jgi:hypothetical protein
MTLDKVKSILSDYRIMLIENGYKPYEGHALVERHILWMIEQVLTWQEERTEKAMRWLGFIQGVLFQKKYYTIKELKHHSMPQGDTTA